jgi:hypothetical protein
MPLPQRYSTAPFSGNWAFQGWVRIRDDYKFGVCLEVAQVRVRVGALLLLWWLLVNLTWTSGFEICCMTGSTWIAGRQEAAVSAASLDRWQCLPGEIICNTVNLSSRTYALMWHNVACTEWLSVMIFIKNNFLLFFGMSLHFLLEVEMSYAYGVNSFCRRDKLVSKRSKMARWDCC